MVSQPRAVTARRGPRSVVSCGGAATTGFSVDNRYSLPMAATFESVPWQTCPWLLERTNIRSFDPPMWCFDLANLGQRDCEAAYVTNINADSMTTYQRCIWDGSKKSCSADRESCVHAIPPLPSAVRVSSPPPVKAPPLPMPQQLVHSLPQVSSSHPVPQAAARSPAPLLHAQASSEMVVEAASPPYRSPPAPAPPLESMAQLPTLGAELSSNFHDTLYQAEACIDGDIRSLCATGRQNHAWVSVQVAEGSTIDRVVVHNRPDNKEYQGWLSPFEVWLGHDFGDTDSEGVKRCGEKELHVPASPGPFTISCSGARGRDFVTLVLIGKPRWLTVAEISIYGKPPSLNAAQPSPSTASALAPAPLDQQHKVVMASYRPAASTPTLAHGAGALHAPAAPIFVSSSCRSVTMQWAAPSTAAAPVRYALFYAPTTIATSERAWSTGLQEARATVTGLQPGVEYSFSVAAVHADGTSSRRSSKLTARPPAKCDAPNEPRGALCHAGGSQREQHRLGAPQVNALSCSALVLELPPLPPDHCDDDPNQRLSVETKRGAGAGWHEIKHNLLSPTLILGGLDAYSAYEYRTVLHRPQLGDRYSESSGLVVVDEPGTGNATGLRLAPLASAEILGGASALVVTWEAVAGGCRAGQTFTVQAADAGSPTADALWSGAWHTVNRNASGGRLVLTADNDLSEVCSGWCTFRLLPNAVAGWTEPTPHSRPVQPLRQGSTLLALLLTVAFFCLAAVMSATAYVVHTDPTLVETLTDLRNTETRVRLWEAVREVLRTAISDGVAGVGAPRECMAGVTENAAWLSKQWRDGLGGGEDDGETGCAIEDEDVAIDGEESCNVPKPRVAPTRASPLKPLSDTELGTDDFAPMLPPPPEFPESGRAERTTPLEAGVLALDSPDDEQEKGQVL